MFIVNVKKVVQTSQAVSMSARAISVQVGTTEWGYSTITTVGVLHFIATINQCSY